jgi:HK97 gp10 family phage protein
MKLDISVTSNLKFEQVTAQVLAAAKAALKDIVINTVQDAKEGSPKLTGKNMRSINWELGPGGDLNLEEMQGAVFSTSGYGGFLETGTWKMKARPYMKPAADRNFTSEKFAERMKEHLGES